MWIIYSFLTAFCETAKDILGKKSGQKTNEYIAAFSFNFFALFIVIPILLIKGIPEIKPVFWLAASFGAVSVPTWSILYMKAIKLSPISLSVPMLAFNPAFTAVLGIFFDRKFPSPIGWIGIILLGVGLYLLRLNREVLKRGIFYPLLQIKNEPGSLAMLLVALIWSFGAHINKVMVVNSSPYWTAFMIPFNASIILFFIARKYAHLNWQTVKRNFHILPLLGIFDGFANLFMALGLNSGITPYVISIKRTNILWSSLLARVFFQESLNRVKILGIMTILIAIVLILIS